MLEALIIILISQGVLNLKLARKPYEQLTAKQQALMQQNYGTYCSKQAQKGLMATSEHFLVTLKNKGTMLLGIGLGIIPVYLLIIVAYFINM